MRQSETWEVGGEFHWAGMPAGPFLPWPHPALWFSLGRHAVLRLLDERGGRRTLWLPSYFCSEVLRAWNTSANVQFYEDSPCAAHPKWETITPEPQDLVVAVNYFGMCNGEAWKDWSRGHPCILVEDHSHDPHSMWAVTSRADYAFCAVRKVMPVPDGAILWSPACLPLPSPAQSVSGSGSETKLTAMMFKSEYLAGRGSLELKEVFRRLQLSGEASLEQAPIGAASPFTLEYLAAGAPQAWRTLRRDNARHLIEELRRWGAAKTLHSRVSDESSPFGVPLVFSSKSNRDYYRELLRLRRIYCPIHWAAMEGSTTDARDLSARIFTIPCDHRYGASDMQYVVATLVQGRSNAH
jgi:hypothetical protein